MDAENEYTAGERCRTCPRFIETPRLARAYVPTQKMCEIFDPEKGLKHGTVFPELYMPYDSDISKDDNDI